MTPHAPRAVVLARTALAAAIATLFCVSPVTAQVPEEAARPVVTMRYKELTNREEFKFTAAGRGEFTKPVGDMNFEFPQGFAPASGLAADQRTFCIEPLVPIIAGRIYNFSVGPINDPASYGLPDTAEGKVAAERRATYACTPGLARPSAGRVSRSVYLAGDYTDTHFPPTLEAATRSGVAAANALIADRRAPMRS